jgi:hypothetical protein
VLRADPSIDIRNRLAGAAGGNAGWPRRAATGDASRINFVDRLHETAHQRGSGVVRYGILLALQEIGGAFTVLSIRS